MNEENQQPLTDKITEADWFLQHLVAVVNSSGFSIGITLQVSGMLVTGELIGGKAYFEGFSSEFSGALKESEKEVDSVRDHFLSIGGVYDEPENALFSPKQEQSPHFIHLKNARFMHTAGSPLPTNRAVWWRGRISEVSGFVLGSLSAARSAES